MVCLIKPQFEAGREKVGKKGVVRDPSVHREVIQKVMDFADLMGFSILGLTWSPVKGPEGNIEYLIHLRRQEREDGSVPEEERAALERLNGILAEQSGISRRRDMRELTESTVEQAHSQLQE